MLLGQNSSFPIEFARWPYHSAALQLALPMMNYRLRRTSIHAGVKVEFDTFDFVDGDKVSRTCRIRFLSLICTGLSRLSSQFFALSQHIGWYRKHGCMNDMR